MEWLTFSLIIESLALGIALAMDAFSVSLTNGMAEPGMRKRKIAGIAGVFGIFQTAMPLIGWICVHTIATQFKKFSVFIPWIGCVLLLYIGGKMLIEGIRGGGSENEENTAVLGFGALIIQGIATSIDALSTGFTIAGYGFPAALAESLIIGIVTFFICVAGIFLGRKIGNKLAGKASILGGVILIIIGLKLVIFG